MSEVTIQFYGVLAEITGTQQIVAKDITSVDGIKNYINTAYPEITKHNYIIAVNNKISGTNTTITNGNIIAVMPPFSGG